MTYNDYLICAGVLVFGYALNLLYITILGVHASDPPCPRRWAG